MMNESSLFDKGVIHMNKFSINDWLTLQTRKDLTFIRRSLEHDSVNYAIFADIFIALFAFVLDHILWNVVDPQTGKIEQVTPSLYWIIIAVLLCLIPTCIFGYGFIKRKIYQSDIKKVTPVEYLVDLFDNEISYNIMTADSMRDLMTKEDSTVEEEIRQFYFIEAMYYVNKAVTQLYSFRMQGNKAIIAGNVHEGVSCSRFQNVCEIISGIYRSLMDISKKNEDYMALFSEAADYINNFNELIHYMSRHVTELSDLEKFMIKK